MRDAYAYLKENLDVYRTLTGPNGTFSFFVRFRDRHNRIYSNVLRQRFPNMSEEERTLISIFMAGGKMACMDWWAHHPSAISANQYVDVTTDLYLQVWDRILKWKQAENRDSHKAGHPDNSVARQSDL